MQGTKHTWRQHHGQPFVEGIASGLASLPEHAASGWLVCRLKRPASQSCLSARAHSCGVFNRLDSAAACWGLQGSGAVVSCALCCGDSSRLVAVVSRWASIVSMSVYRVIPQSNPILKVEEAQIITCLQTGSTGLKVRACKRDVMCWRGIMLVLANTCESRRPQKFRPGSNPKPKRGCTSHRLCLAHAWMFQVDCICMIVLTATRLSSIYFYPATLVVATANMAAGMGAVASMPCTVINLGRRRWGAARTEVVMNEQKVVKVESRGCAHARQHLLIHPSLAAV